MKRVFRGVVIVVVNVMVFAGLCGAVELYFRLRHPAEARLPANALWQVFRPYVMFTTTPGHYPGWQNEFTGKTIASTVTTNSLGFNDPHEFSYTKPYQKEPNEKVVLFTGGSSAWGVGSSATDKTVAGRMQYYLDTSQDKTKYTVINIAMGSYIAYQQFLAMSLWGQSFDPDWVVSMDGFNDAEAECGYSQGAGNPMYYAAMQAYVSAYMFAPRHPVFYRGWLENQLIKYSVAYRILTEREYVADDLMLERRSNETEAARLAIIPTKIGAARDILEFYVKAEQLMLDLFPRAKFILSTQPVVNDFRGDFVDIYDSPPESDAHRQAAALRSDALEKYLTVNQDLPCGHDNAQISFTYDFVDGAIRLEQLVEQQKKLGRDIYYYNVGTQFPNDREARIPFFIDPVHLSDAGMDTLGRFYANRILAADGAAAAKPK